MAFSHLIVYLELWRPSDAAGFAQRDGNTIPHTCSYIHVQPFADGNADAYRNIYSYIQRDLYAVTDLDAHTYPHL